ncbi:hypothetical protein PSTEL_10500 [Paenibacillus stellifer]|uniref:Uncharacterized protein n=1 Tax=Paenibacillus stellifer TaxID=169760 RepID=A0A089LPL6_9BACL|nr:hypothetical protein PSTEL_10500 [Paenibacillus stellifer]
MLGREETRQVIGMILPQGAGVSILPLFKGRWLYYVRAIFAVFSESPLTFFLAENILSLKTSLPMIQMRNNQRT